MAVLVIAHRGARTEAPDNTMAAFELAVDAGADMIEFDVQLTRTSGRRHARCDPRPDHRHAAGSPSSPGRTCAGHGRRRPGLIPRTSQAGRLLALCRHSGIAVNVELKPASDDFRSLADAVVELVRKTRFPAERVLISCFNHDALRYIEKSYPEYALAALYKTRPENPLNLPGSVIHPEFGSVDEHFMQAAKAAGKRVNVWTLNREEEWRRALELGADGITTDEPRLLRSLLRKGKLAGTASLRPNRAIPYAAGSKTEPRNSTAPVSSSRMATKNGRSATNSNSYAGKLVTAKSTDVAAAASVPSSSTIRTAWWLTSLMYTFCPGAGSWISPKSARPGSKAAAILRLGGSLQAVSCTKISTRGNQTWPSASGSRPSLPILVRDGANSFNLRSSVGRKIYMASRFRPRKADGSPGTLPL